MEKVTIIYDATLLIVGFRSGLYNVALNVLKALLERKSIEIILFFKSNIPSEKINKLLLEYNWQRLPFTVGNTMKAGYINNFAHSNNFKLLNKIINKYHADKYHKSVIDICLLKNKVFFSPLFIAPDCYLRNKEISKYLILYDTIPHFIKNEVPPEKFSTGWYAESLNSFGNGTLYFAISENTKKDFLNFGKNAVEKDIRVLPLAADKKIFYQEKNVKKNESVRTKYFIPKNKKYILSLCSLEPHKNLIFTAECFLKFKLENDINDLVFVIAGSNATGRIEALEKLKKIVNENDDVILTGYIDQDDLAALYSNANCFVFNSLYEGFGLPPLEAMQCGTPVITSNRSSIPEVVGDSAILINPESENELINAFSKIYFASELKLNEYSRNSLKRSSLFSWESSAQLIENIIRSDLEL